MWRLVNVLCISSQFDSDILLAKAVTFSFRPCPEQDVMGRASMCRVNSATPIMYLSLADPGPMALSNRRVSPAGMVWSSSGPKCRALIMVPRLKSWKPKSVGLCLARTVNVLVRLPYDWRRLLYMSLWLIPL